MVPFSHCSSALLPTIAGVMHAISSSGLCLIVGMCTCEDATVTQSAQTPLPSLAFFGSHHGPQRWPGCWPREDVLTHAPFQHPLCATQA